MIGKDEFEIVEERRANKQEGDDAATITEGY